MKSGKSGICTVAVLLSLTAACGGPDPAPGRTPGPPASGTAKELPGCTPTMPPAGGARQLRGAWITTVRNMDWPSRPGLPMAKQQAEYRRLLDAVKAVGLNAVFVQVRPTADALYPSPYEPWSKWLTGRQGQAPGYDPMRFLVDETHARGLEFHAWFNPYRVGGAADRGKLAATHPARANPGWLVRYGKQLWYDPGLPQVRELTERVVLDVVGKYDVDGVHFDDYFYPYPEPGAVFRDGATFTRYGSGFASKAAWRRHNVDTLIERLGDQVHRAKPWVRFGVSPFGVWRNRASDPAGSATNALQSYDQIHADTRKWIKKGWLDYVVPQLYWPIGFDRADYRVLVGWWARQVAGTSVRLYIGQAAYQVGTAGPWNDPAELSRHLILNARHRAVRGDVFFSAQHLRRDAKGFATLLRDKHYARPALLPAPAGDAGDATAKAPAEVTAAATTGRVRLRWRGGGRSYAIYRMDGKHSGCGRLDGRRLIASVSAAGGMATAEFVDTSVESGATYTYYVTALDRLHRESPPGNGVIATT